ncbi:MAG: alpha/beta hydrolase, partial [Cyanobacteria bacterium J06607_13]
WVKTHIHQLTLPVLLTHGGADPIVASTGTQAIFQQIQSPDKTLRLYPGSYHEPHNDLDADQVVSDLLHWLDGHIAAEGLPKVC